MSQIGANLKSKKKSSAVNNAKYPRHTLARAIRLPEAIVNQNAGKACSDRDLASYIGVKYSGPFSVELGSAIKYGLLERPSPGHVIPTDLAKKIVKPQSPADKLQGAREAFLKAPDLSDVYNHYRNENIPDSQFFDNALQETFKIPLNKISEFKQIFFSSLTFAELSEETNGKIRILDVTEQLSKKSDGKSDVLIKLGKSVKIETGDSCFVMMPFAKPVGDYYEKIYSPAIVKAGLTPVRADSDIFGTGKIIEQIWSGINASKVLIADLTGRNPNVFYELGLAHALDRPVVLVCANETDVPFDLKHIRVIYYDQTDPFWGQKLIEKVAENILSALKNPNEAKFKAALSAS